MRWQTIARPAGPLTRPVLVAMLAQLGEHPPVPVRNAPTGGPRRRRTRRYPR